jgi:hypothetical protein
MSLLTQGIAQVTAAAKAGMSERTARKYAHSGRAPSQAKVSHTWRTRPDPFVEVWPEVEALLRQDAGLQAKTIWMELNERHAGRFSTGQLRTLQRRLLAWRATSGPDREVFFPQTHVPRPRRSRKWISSKGSSGRRQPRGLGCWWRRIARGSTANSSATGT